MNVTYEERCEICDQVIDGDTQDVQIVIDSRSYSKLFCCKAHANEYMWSTRVRYLEP
jgi:hypothetical protein